MSGFGVPSQALPASEPLPALDACGVPYIELLERLKTRGRPSYDLPQFHEAAAAEPTHTARLALIITAHRPSRIRARSMRSASRTSSDSPAVTALRTALPEP